MKKLNNKINFPNLFTTLNLFFGVVSIIAIVKRLDKLFLYCFFLSLFFDSIDGWFARLKNQTTEFGKKYDAFADIFSFGLILTFLIWAGIFKSPPLFWPITLSVWITIANIVRYFKLVKMRDKVYGVPNVAVSILIVALYFQEIIDISLISWTYIILISTLLMLVPIEFTNHKIVKNNILPKKPLYGFYFALPIILLPLLDVLNLMNPMWLLIAIMTIVYIFFGIIKGIQIFIRDSSWKFVKWDYKLHFSITAILILCRIFSIEKLIESL